MKRTAPILVQSLFAILTSGPLGLTAHAQYDSGVTADIPFGFSVGGQENAAGTYKLELVNSQFILSLRNVSTGHEEIIAVRPEDARSFQTQGRLIFQVCDHRIYLAEIHIPGSSLYSEAISRRTQRSAERAACSKEDSTVIALR